jgi:hypothetical protein
MKRHIFALLLALLVGAIYAGPDIYMAHTPGYQGVLMAQATDEGFYLTALNKSYDSQGPIGDPFQYEYRNFHNPFQYFLIEFAIGKTGSVLHLPLDVLVPIMEFVFPALLTLLLYAFAYAISRSRLSAFFAAAMMLLGNEVVHPDGIANLYHTFLFRGEYTEFITYARLVNPQISSLFFFGSLFCLYYLFTRPHSWRLALLAGVAVGLLVYIYPYFWAFAFVALGTMFLYGLAVRHWSLVLAVAGAGGVCVSVMLPFLLANLPIFLHGGGGQLTQAIPTHHIIIEMVILLPLFLYTLVYLWAWWSKGGGRLGQWAKNFADQYLFVFLLLFAGVIVSNQQVITGKLLSQLHFHFYTNIPIFLLSMSILGMEIVRLLGKRWQVVAVCAAAILLIWYAASVQVLSYRSHVTEAMRYQQLGPIFSYLRERASVQSVVLTDWSLSTGITSNTPDYAYTTGGYDNTFTVPAERIIHDYFVMLELRGVSADSVRSYMYQPENRDELGSILFFGAYWRDTCGSYTCFPDSVIEDLVPQYKEFLSHPLLEQIKKYKINYVLWDSVADSGWNIRSIVGTPLYTSGNFTLYTIK